MKQCCLEKNKLLINFNEAKSETGSVALEYVLVSTFATVVGVALLSFAGHIFKQKVEGIMDRFSIDHDEIEFSIFENLP